MRIYTPLGDLAFKTFTFPDGQPHFKLETYEQEFDLATIETAIKSPWDLLLVLLASDVLRAHGYSSVNLDIRYLMGARMDRAIDWSQPFTLQTIARLINGAGFSRVRILDAHSEVATRLIRNSSNQLPYRIVESLLTTLGVPAVACPDKGAVPRVQKLVGMLAPIVYCSKKRDMATGVLSDFEVLDYQSNDRSYSEGVLIVDDICDGGGTFVGLAKELRDSGAKQVYLYVTHGIFSRGLPLDGIDHVYTTDSYCKCAYDWDAAHRGLDVAEIATIIPVSMKEIP